MSERRETRKHWVQRGRFAVEVDVEVLRPDDGQGEPCLEPEAIQKLDEVARRAEAGDLAYLRTVGRVFEAVAPEDGPSSESEGNRRESGTAETHVANGTGSQGEGSPNPGEAIRRKLSLFPFSPPPFNPPRSTDEYGRLLPRTEEQRRAWIQEGNRALDALAEITDETDDDEEGWDEIMRNLGVDPRPAGG